MVIELFFTVLALFVTAFLLWKASWLSYRNLPPGPRPWPIVGNMLMIRNMRQAFKRVAEEYGPICCIWMGSTPFILVSGAELMHEALVTRAEFFSERNQRKSKKILNCNFRNVNSSNGPLWRTLRRNLIHEVLNSTRVKSFKHVRDFEFRDLIQRFKKEARDNDGVVHAMAIIRRTLFNILNTMCFGERMDEKLVRDIDAVMAERFLKLKGRLADYIPIVQLFDWQQTRDTEALLRRTNDLMMPALVKLREAMRNGESVSGRYVETLLQMQEKEGKDQISDEVILALCSEVLNAGTDTTAQSSEWILARVVAFPEVQRKLVEEMETVLGDKTIDESDIEHLPYLRAVVRETQRLDGPFGFSLAHAVSQPGVKLAGFDIPTDAMIMFRISSVSHDPKIWGDPKNFRPERFLNEMANVDLTGTKSMALIPFGAGRRICPGMNLAILQMCMIVGLLVQTFEWSNGEAGEVEFIAGEGAIGGMKNPLKARIRERKRSTVNKATAI